MITHGKCQDVLKSVEANHYTTIITDPPYGLSFMGKKWDYEIPSIDIWEECLRVLKPGGTLLCFAGTRTQHRMTCNIEDAGFIIKDCLMWLYGSGFPKATDISKQLDKMNGREFEPFQRYLKQKREEKGLNKSDIDRACNIKASCYIWEGDKTGQNHLPTWKSYIIIKDILELDDRFDEVIKRIEAEREVIGQKKVMGKEDIKIFGKFKGGMQDITTPTTHEAKQWSGYKSHALKPAYEPIIMCMKPNNGTYADNAIKHGVAGINVDKSRVFRNSDDISGWSQSGSKESENRAMSGKNYDREAKPDTQGRFPANIILDEEAGKMLDEQSGVSKSSGHVRHNTYPESMCYGTGLNPANLKGINDSGGASRFFYCAKASKSERGEGNSHPTVKPPKLMEYLIKLAMPPENGLLLDPFAGSGSTLIAAQNLGYKADGIEMSEEYYEIALARLNNKTTTG